MFNTSWSKIALKREEVVMSIFSISRINKHNQGDLSLPDDVNKLQLFHHNK
nr:MAG TPA: hypothetical protein [Caudoviricetes sp.]